MIPYLYHTGTTIYNKHSTTIIVPHLSAAFILGWLAADLFNGVGVGTYGINFIHPQA